LKYFGAIWQMQRSIYFTFITGNNPTAYLLVLSLMLQTTIIYILRDSYHSQKTPESNHKVDATKLVYPTQVSWQQPMFRRVGGLTNIKFNEFTGNIFDKQAFKFLYQFVVVYKNTS
jgi:hypothetical protein